MRSPKLDVHLVNYWYLISMLFLYLSYGNIWAIANILPEVRFGTIYYHVFCKRDDLNPEDQANPHIVTGDYPFLHPLLRRNLRRQMLNVARVNDAQLRLDTEIKGVSALIKLKLLKFPAANLYDTMHTYLLNTTRNMIG